MAHRSQERATSLTPISQIRPRKKGHSLGLSTFFVLLSLVCPARSQQTRFEEVARFSAPDAHQGVAVDNAHFYGIGTKTLVKYTKDSGKELARGAGPAEGLLIHLDSGVVVDGRIYCAHSNFPGLPMTSSIEIWDAASMKHVATRSFGIMWGSCTWVDRHDGFWWAVFGSYSRVFGPSRTSYGNTYWTTLVKFDDRWQWLEAWTFPEAVLQRSEPMSISGGSWGPDGLLYCTGHDRPEVYALRLPRAGSILELVETIPIVTPGQGIAWDRSRSGYLYSIDRARKQVVVSRLVRGRR
jgi:hypothetical protein